MQKAVICIKLLSMSRKRLDTSVFDLPIHELRRGYRSDIYFWRSKVLLEKDGRHPRALIQAFQKKNAVLCGIDEAIAIIKVASGFYRNREKAYKLFDRLMKIKAETRRLFHANSDRFLGGMKEKLKVQEALDNLWENRFQDLDVKALHDGDPITPLETVLTIEGDAGYFIHLETLYLGALARRTRVATNVNNVVRAAAGKPVLFFPARFDHWGNQGGDGYAARIGGASLVSTDAQAAWWGSEGAGTIPHALIACYGGDTATVAERFAEYFPGTNCIALVDFDNDCVRTSLEAARKLKGKLYGVRLDTSETMVDKSVQDQMGQFKPTGVCEELVWNVRNALDREGFRHVRIIVSGGFNAEKIRSFEENGAPVDSYGVGSNLLAGSFDFTADVVMVDGKHRAKAGRMRRPNRRLRKVKMSEEAAAILARRGKGAKNYSGI